MNKLRLFVMAFLLFGQPCHADETSVEKFVSQVADRIISIVSSRNSGADAKTTQLNAVIKESFDTNWMSKYAIGRHASALTPNQLAQYKSKYLEYLQATYVPILEKYDGQTYKIVRTVKASDSSHPEYDCTVEINGHENAQKAPLLIRYRIKEVSPTEFLAKDMIIENISTVLAQRSEFSELLERGGAPALINHLSQLRLRPNA